MPVQERCLGSRDVVQSLGVQSLGADSAIGRRPHLSIAVSGWSIGRFFTTCIFIVTLFAGTLAAQSSAWQPQASVDLSAVDSAVSHPYGLTIHPQISSRLAYVAVAGDVAPFGEPASLFSGQTIAEICVDTLEIVRTFTVGYFPTETVVTSDGMFLYAVTSTESTLFEVDLTTGGVSTIGLTDSTGNPVDFLSGLILSPDETEVWVTSNGGSFDGSSENLLVVDRMTAAVVERVTIAGSLGRLAVRDDGRLVVPVGFPDDDFTAPPQIRIYDTVGGFVLVDVLQLTVDTSDFPAPSDVDMLADGSRAYVTVFGGSAEVFVVDVSNATLLSPLTLAGPDFVQSTVDLTEDDSSLIVGDFFGGRLRVLDPLTGDLQAEVQGLDLPVSAIASSGRLFVAEQGLEQVLVISLPGAFLRGDANGDEMVNVADGVAILSYLFTGGALPCLDAADTDDGGQVDLADAISIFSYLFQGGPPPGVPFPVPGTDLADTDALDCGP